MRRKQLVVIGSSEEARYACLAFEIGNFIAQNGWIPVCCAFTAGWAGIIAGLPGTEGVRIPR